MLHAEFQRATHAGAIYVLQSESTGQSECLLGHGSAWEAVLEEMLLKKRFREFSIEMQQYSHKTGSADGIFV